MFESDFSQKLLLCYVDKCYILLYIA